MFTYFTNEGRLTTTVFSKCLIPSHRPKDSYRQFEHLLATAIKLGHCKCGTETVNIFTCGHTPVADLHTKILDVSPPPSRGPNSFNFIQFLGTLGKIVCWRPYEGLAPPPRGNPGFATAHITIQPDISKCYIMWTLLIFI